LFFLLKLVAQCRSADDDEPRPRAWLINGRAIAGRYYVIDCRGLDVCLEKMKKSALRKGG
jgi:hypothetical protein